MKKPLRRLLLIVISFFFLFSLAPVSVFAQEQISSFTSRMIAHKDGTLSVQEIIVYDFGQEERHGIFRTIPLISRVGDLYRVIDISVKDVKRDDKSEQYTIDRSSDEIEIKIGSPDQTIQGEHTYTLSYTVANGIGSNYEDHDEIYWNITGNGWDIPIQKASVVLATDFAVPVGKVLCFTGTSGSTENKCSVSDQGIGKTVTTESVLNPQEGLTIVAAFPLNTFPKSTLQKSKPMDPDAKSLLITLVSVLVFFNFILAPAVLYWYFTKKHKKRFGKPTVSFDLPKDSEKSRITPAEAGTIDTTKLDKDDITATIFDLAIRKYIRIEEQKKQKRVLGLGNKTDFTLKKLKDFSDLNEFEKTLMEALFAGEETATLSDVSLSYTDFQNLEKANFRSLISRGFYTKNPKVQMGALMGLGIASLFTLNVVLGPVLLFLSRMLNGRTEKGDEMDFKIDGLKIFLKATNRYNEWQAKNILTIEKMIPYAMSLGYIDQFMKQLKILKPDYQPSWYRGSSPFYHTYTGFSTSMGDGITTSAPSSSSGFSGGSSGGGGGGGGGGSW